MGSTLSFRLKQLTYYGGRRLKHLADAGGRRLLRVKRLPGSRRLRQVSARTSAAMERVSRVRPPVTEDLAAWSRAHDLEVRVLSPAQTRVRQAPTPVDIDPHPNYTRHLSATIAERFLVCLPDARVWGANGLVVLPDGSFAAQAIYDVHHLEADPAYSTPTRPRAVRKEGDYFSLVGEFSNAGNYYHWLHDGVLRLHGTQGHLPAGVRYLVPSPLLKHQRETLHLLGLRDDDLEPFTGESVWECERLWFASLPPSGAEVPDAVYWVRERLLAAIGVEHTECRRRLYVSRESAIHARVVNEAELAPVLERHGFEVVHGERLSVADQARLFSQAEAIVAPTGSGQTNLLFASPETKNLEILEPQWAEKKAWVVWTLAETLGQPYWYVMGQTRLHPKIPSRADLYVPPRNLERALEQVLR